MNSWVVYKRDELKKGEIFRSTRTKILRLGRNLTSNLSFLPFVTRSKCTLLAISKCKTVSVSRINKVGRSAQKRKTADTQLQRALGYIFMRALPTKADIHNLDGGEKPGAKVLIIYKEACSPRPGEN